MTRTALVAIVNLSPDSFSGDGASSAAQAIAYAKTQLEAGAMVLDVGAESTRPGATPLSAAQEWQRLAPVMGELAALCQSAGAKLSIDTRHAATATRALAAGADWINDVGGLQSDEMLHTVAASTCHCVLMHSLSVPAAPEIHLPHICDAPQEIRRWFAQQMERLAHGGIAADRLILDPGIGFGKTAAQSVAILAEAASFRTFGLPVLIGHSRKSFLKLFSDHPDTRDPLTLAFSAILMQHDIDYLRVHHVATHHTLRKALYPRAVHAS